MPETIGDVVLRMARQHLAADGRFDSLLPSEVETVKEPRQSLPPFARGGQGGSGELISETPITGAPAPAKRNEDNVPANDTPNDKPRDRAAANEVEMVKRAEEPDRPLPPFARGGQGGSGQLLFEAPMASAPSPSERNEDGIAAADTLDDEPHDRALAFDVESANAAEASNQPLPPFARGGQGGSGEMLSETPWESAPEPSLDENGLRFSVSERPDSFAPARDEPQEEPRFTYSKHAAGNATPPDPPLRRGGSKDDSGDAYDSGMQRLVNTLAEQGGQLEDVLSDLETSLTSLFTTQFESLSRLCEQARQQERRWVEQSANRRAIV